MTPAVPPTPPFHGALNLGVASEMGIGAEDAQDVLMAIAPIVGPARVASATGNIVRALGFAIEVAELQEEETEVSAVCGPGSTRMTFLREAPARLPLSDECGSRVPPVTVR